jgi:hypothetical protein
MMRLSETKTEAPVSKQFIEELLEIKNSGWIRFIEEVSALIDKNKNAPLMFGFNKETLILQSKILRFLELAKYHDPLVWGKETSNITLIQAENLDEQITRDLSESSRFAKHIEKHPTRRSSLSTLEVLSLEIWYTSQLFQKYQRLNIMAIKFIRGTAIGRKSPFFEGQPQEIDDWLEERNQHVIELWQEGLHIIQDLKPGLRAEGLIKLYSLCNDVLKLPEQRSLNEQILDTQPFQVFFKEQKLLLQSQDNLARIHEEKIFDSFSPKNMSYSELFKLYRNCKRAAEEVDPSSLLHKKYLIRIKEMEKCLTHMQEMEEHSGIELDNQIRALLAEIGRLLELAYPDSCPQKNNYATRANKMLEWRSDISKSKVSYSQ